MDKTDSTPSLVDLCKRNHFLPDLFGHEHYLRGERAVYAYMRQLCHEYNGGYWEYYTVPGSGFMAPTQQEKYAMENPENWFSGTMSAQAAGITATLYALGHLAGITGDPDIAEKYYALLDFASGLPEASLIRSAID